MNNMQNSDNKQTVLVTGGAGYIGAHTVRQLVKEGISVVVVDNLSTGKQINIAQGAEFVQGDFSDPELLYQIFDKYSISAVMHFAASIEVGESVEKPLDYLDNNTIKSARLIRAMLDKGVKNLVFSSTAAVYGLQEKVPIAETAPIGPLDPYGYSKWLTEQIITYHAKFAGLNAVIFRYFNACGSDFDKTIYSSHESHLIPRVIDAVEGRLKSVGIYGTNYNTIDGTGVRDYVHVLDVARAHLAALQSLEKSGNPAGSAQPDAPQSSAIKPNCEVYNIGTSSGLSVKQIIAAVEKVTGKTVPVEILDRRPGDSPITVADNTKIREQLGFELKHSDLETIIKTSWH
jgi:UDP-glucose 4-epimerase